MNFLLRKRLHYIATIMHTSAAIQPFSVALPLKYYDMLLLIAAFVWYFGNTYSIKIYVLLHFEHHNVIGHRFSWNNLHLLDRTETNIIFIWSGKVPNITLPDQINMILGKVLSNKCFIIPAHNLECAHPVHRTFY